VFSVPLLSTILSDSVLPNVSFETSVFSTVETFATTSFAVTSLLLSPCELWHISDASLVTFTVDTSPTKALETDAEQSFCAYLPTFWVTGQELSSDLVVGNFSNDTGACISCFEILVRGSKLFDVTILDASGNRLTKDGFVVEGTTELDMTIGDDDTIVEVSSTGTSVLDLMTSSEVSSQSSATNIDFLTTLTCLSLGWKKLLTRSSFQGLIENS